MFDNPPPVTGSKKNKKRNYNQGMLPAKAKPKTTMKRIVAMMAELEQRWSIMVLERALPALPCCQPHHKIAAKKKAMMPNSPWNPPPDSQPEIEDQLKSFM